MISVLIVDDEHLIRKLVRNSIEWDALDMEVVGEAENGEEAIRFLKQHPVDIAIVDINMPFVNGIGFAEYVYKNHLQTKVILLTGYREFEYARQAIQWKVVDYLLKPLKISELESTLHSISDSYYRSKSKLSPKEMARAKLRDFANGISDEVPEECRDLEDVFALVLRIDRAAALDNLRGELTYICESTSRYIAEHLPVKHVAYVEYDSYVVHFICTDERLQEEKERIALADEIREQVSRWRRYTVTAGISGVMRDSSGLGAALQEALDAAANRFYQTADCTYAARETVHLEYSRRLKISSQINTLLSAAGERGKADRRACCDMLREILDEFRVEQVDEDYVKLTILHFVLSLYSAGNIASSRSRKRIDKLMDYEQFQDFQEAVEGIFCRFLDSSEEEERGGLALSALTTKVRKYIDEQFADRDISLNTIAASVYANPTYISNQFKKEMGLTITEYITSCRMKKAQQLISTGSKSSLQEIADEVGYNDPYYFSKSFKKYYGTTPSRYLIERG